MTTSFSNLVVRNYMTAAPMTVDGGLTIADAQDRMLANNIRHLIVVSDGIVRGIVSSRDLAFALSIPGTSGKLTVADAMTRNPYCCTTETPVAEVARAMEAYRYGCAVVLEQGTVVGVFTTTDALRVLREVVLGHQVKPQNPPTHAPYIPEVRPNVPAHERIGDGATPSANLGKLF